MVLVHLHLSPFLWDLNSAGTWQSSSPAKPFVAVRLGSSQSGFSAAAAAVPSFGVHKQTWGPQGSQQLPPLCHCCSQTGISSPLSLAGLRPSVGAAAESPEVPAGPAAPGDTKEGFVIPAHPQIPVICSILELPCSPSKRL